MSIDDISTEALKEELKKRMANDTRPLPINNPDYSDLVKTCELVMEDYAKLGYSKDADRYITESALRCVYGAMVYDWIYDGGC